MTAITKTQGNNLKAAGKTNQESEEAIPSTVARGVFGGTLMGLANLVPGISGGTMLLAAGVYTQFVNAIAEYTTFRFRFRSTLVLASVGISAVLGILIFAGLLKELVVNHRWVMYSLFVGLTLGGLPVVYKMAKPIRPSTWIAAGVAFLAMVLFAVMQMTGVVASSDSNFFMLFLAGLGGASAMILPGLSGGYILLLLGQYVPILDGVSSFKDALTERDFQAAMEPALGVMLPVGLGVVAGVVVVSNLLKWLLKKYRPATLGVLIGLLLGSIVGLWPFQHSVEPIVGETVIKGQLVTDENVAEFEPKDWPTETFAPTLAQAGGGLGLVVLGMVITLGVATIGGRNKSTESEPPNEDN